MTRADWIAIVEALVAWWLKQTQDGHRPSGFQVLTRLLALLKGQPS